MEQIVRLLLVSIAFLNFAILGSSSLSGCVGRVALQGYCLALLPLFIHKQGLTPRAMLLIAGMAFFKGWLIPRVLLHALRQVRVRREVEPLVGYVASLILGAVLLGVAFTLADRLPIPGAVRSDLLVPVALATIMIGLFMTVSRVKALTQVVGYLVFENGIYLFGLSASFDLPWLLELGVLLDVFVGVFVMGIVIHHIGQAFDSIHTDRMSQLRD